VAMRILIVDDHPITRSGLRTALDESTEVEVVGEASSGEEAVETSRT
jgi:DNA-binding NarL/FixJ family response regulator